MIDWNQEAHQATLLQLAIHGVVPLNKSNKDLCQHLLAEGWLAHSPRRSELQATTLGRQHSEAILAARWPNYSEDAQAILAAYGVIAAKHIRLFRKSEFRATSDHLRSFPPVLNRKTFAAAILGHSKAQISDEVLAKFAGLKLVGDHILSIRANKGLLLQIGSSALGLDDQMNLYGGSVPLTERMLISAWAPTGQMPRAIMSIENPATFHDADVPDDVLAVHVEGWNTPLATIFLRKFDTSIPVVHFGDYDPNGVAIANHLSSLLDRKVVIFAPEFATEYVKSHGLPHPNEVVAWGDVSCASDDKLFAELQQQGVWLEQESITLDGRFLGQLVALLGEQDSP